VTQDPHPDNNRESSQSNHTKSLEKSFQIHNRKSPKTIRHKSIVTEKSPEKKTQFNQKLCEIENINNSDNVKITQHSVTTIESE
jgi:hypothetical protein